MDPDWLVVKFNKLDKYDIIQDQTGKCNKKMGKKMKFELQVGNEIAWELGTIMCIGKLVNLY